MSRFLSRRVAALLSFVLFVLFVALAGLVRRAEAEAGTVSSAASSLRAPSRIGVPSTFQEAGSVVGSVASAGKTTFGATTGVGSAYRLTVYGGNNDGVKVIVPNTSTSNAQFVLSAGSEPLYGQGALFQLNSPSSSIDPNAFLVINRTAGPIIWGTSSTERLRLFETGNLAVGSTSDTGAAKLQVTGGVQLTNSGLTFSDGTTQTTRAVQYVAGPIVLSATSIESAVAAAVPSGSRITRILAFAAFGGTGAGTYQACVENLSTGVCLATVTVNCTAGGITASNVNIALTAGIDLGVRISSPGCTTLPSYVSVAALLSP